MPEEITLGEVARRLDRLEDGMGAQFAGVHRQIESLQFVSREVYEARHNAVLARLTELEERDRFRARVVWTSFVWPVVVAFVVAAVLTR